MAFLQNNNPLSQKTMEEVTGKVTLMKTNLYYLKGLQLEAISVVVS